MQNHGIVQALEMHIIKWLTVDTKFDELQECDATYITCVTV